MNIDTMKNILPNFIGIGAQKCGSTWIYRILEDHPEAMVSIPKELNFFSYNYNYGYQWYRSLFNNLNDVKICGEISPSYFHDYSSAIHSARYNPDFSIVVVLRDPVERAFSNHLHEIRIGHFKGPDLSFEAGLKNNPMYIKQSCYFKHLKHWYAQFPEDQILVLFLENIQNDPLREAKKLFGFLGIDQDHKSAFLFKKANESYSERIKGVDDFFKKIGRISRQIGGASIIEKIKNNKLIIRFRQSNRIHLSKTVPELKKATTQMLYEQFADDTLNLAKLLELKTLPWETWHRAIKH